MKKPWAILSACVLAFICITARSQEFFFKDGDNPAVFLGDSITEQKQYTTYIEAYVLTRFPKWNITFRNIGWGGDTSWLSQRKGFDNGMKRDILSLKPKSITIDFGMNDARGGDGNYPKYVEHSTKLAQQLKAAGTRVALVTPSPEERYEEGQPGGSKYNHMLWKYSEGLKGVAEKEGVGFVDQYTPFIKVIEDGRKSGVLGATGGVRLVPDAVHPNWAGHLVMATSILKGLHAPALVSRAEIDAAGKKVVAQEGCTIELQQGGDGLQFTRTDNALPMPIHKDAELTMKIPGYTPLEDLSRYELKVTGLTAAKYDFSVDGAKTATFTKEELEKGVNLTLVAGPITQQAQKVFHTIYAKNEMFYNRWRNVQIFTVPDWLKSPEIDAKQAAELARLDAEIAKKEAEINAIRQPLPHVFALVPAK